MLLLDGLYINTGGGKILLDLIVKYLFDNSIDTIFLFDKRLEDNYNYLPSKSKYFLTPSLIQRHLFYKKNKNRFKSVLVFNNIPPTIKLDCRVYTYFHNVLYLEGNLFTNFSIFLKSKVVRYFSNNTDKWVVQSNYVKSILSKKWKIEGSNILILPIFNDQNIAKTHFSTNKPKNSISYIYVSDGHEHKNHLRLFEAFEMFYRNNKNCSLIVTISDLHSNLKQKILQLNQRGIPIIDIGFVTFEKLTYQYLNADIVIFPSLHESFGLGLIEAAKFNLPIMVSNLPYAYEVVEPNITFDPFSSSEIYNAFIKSNEILDKKSKIKCENKINQLINEIK